jgi:RNA polymerase sigma-70 factor (ECF subfamily)
MDETSADLTREDLEAIRYVLAGNRNAFSVLVDKYQGRVRGYCLGVLGEADAAQDAAQEIFIKAYRSLASFQGKASFSTWLYRISVNYCYDVLRQRGRRKTESWEALLEKDGDRIEELLSVGAEADRSVENAELVRRVLACLSEKNRTVITLREIQGLSYQEMAETLDCTVDSIKAQLRRARQEIENKMRHLCKEAGV